MSSKEEHWPLSRNIVDDNRSLSLLPMLFQLYCCVCSSWHIEDTFSWRRKAWHGERGCCNSQIKTKPLKMTCLNTHLFGREVWYGVAGVGGAIMH